MGIQIKIGPRALATTAATGAAIGAAVAAQRRHLRALARDDDYLELTAPLGGRPIQVTSADGTVLHAEAFGPDDAPTLVLAHGWTEALRFWGPVIKLLRRRGLRVVAYDLRGHGRSEPAAGGDYALERFGEDVEAVLAAAVEGDRRATVAGHSLGAMSIAAWAEHHDPGARAQAAALINTGLGDLLASHLVLGEAAKWLNHPRASRAVLGANVKVPPFSTPLQQAVIRHVAFGPDATAAQIAFYEQMLIECPSDVRAACGVAVSDMNLWHAIANLTIPTLVVAGDRDRLTPPEHSRRIARELPRPAGLVELSDTGHMSPLERPSELSDLLERLARESTTAPSVVGERR
jgi:pimeloyl-ACP methyl ester carboxylesterase